MDIYLDVLFLENIIMNYFILKVTARFSKNRTSNLRIFLGALLGASYVVFLILLPGIKSYYTTFAKIVLSFAIIAVSFSPETIGNFLKTLVCFYLSTFVFAGAAFSFIYFNQSGGIIKNGIVYISWQSKWTVLILAVITAGIATRVLWDIYQYRFTRDRLLVPIKVVFDSRIITIEALVDTGNSLHDPLTNMPVIVVEFKAIKDVLPQDIQNIFADSMENDLNRVTSIISNTTWISRFRIIPFTSLGVENGILLGFKPDFIEIGSDDSKKSIKDVIIGVYNRTLSKNERYKALLSPDLVN